ncbi:unnamed protein product [Trichobilharzia regenti]|nr:unnamed protein product [Trichobilharzia regenti]
MSTGNSQYDPTTIPCREIAQREKDKYLLFSCIDYIYQCKTGPFEEHSNTLYGISQVPMWEKVNSGLIKMYKGEVSKCIAHVQKLIHITKRLSLLIILCFIMRFVGDLNQFDFS